MLSGQAWWDNNFLIPVYSLRWGKSSFCKIVLLFLGYNSTSIFTFHSKRNKIEIMGKAVMEKVKLELKGVTVELTLEALAEGLRKLSNEELEELEMLLVLDELKKRSKEVKQGKYVHLSDLKSLKNV